MEKDNETYLKLFWGRSNHEKSCLLSKKGKSTALSTTVILLVCFVATFLVLTIWNTSTFAALSIPISIIPTTKPQEQEFPLSCTQNVTQTCSRDYPTIHTPTNPTRTCPSYFRWIHEDLWPWRERDRGITREMLEGARRTAHFRLVIVDGKLYVEKYKKAIQTRDVFTLWGILQLLRMYPGKVPDLELLFDCDDRPVVSKERFKGPNAPTPPLFRYCSDQWSLDIVFPDWSFWGWAEINIKPWKHVLKEIKEGNEKTKWKDRVPYAYWKGNPLVSPTRKDLMKCNVTEKDDWNTHLYIQDWDQESSQGYKKSNLGDQCTHRYKIYVEGWAWSVSEKYILACDSTTLYVRSRFHDFFVRGMVPLEHYWPIRDNSKCKSLKFAVEWGNNNTDKAQAIGEAGSKFIHEDMDMDYVYDYMFHLLNEYAKLQRFKPTIPQNAVEYCPETMACGVDGIQRRFMEDSMVKSPSDSNPCTLPPPYEPINLQDFLEKKASSIRQVETWEDQYWEKEKGGQ
ncbi:hypothetical protein JHK82_017794 [Glycine max]|uniref:Protein O-glucosyltransferase 1 n=1 Tax=Glycine soja TaxID=3848 RepID=A0A445JTP4_GLYSO|nr:protein O-glucosyltransferase 1-like [Glycine soja]KAG5142099.1 hypothetical protein JHK82_017794 [Glycine max]KAG5009221.1 hypothetical protein JHK87_017736 [Glycine soja]KAH1085826.1 hypothetical protein GYH30_017675 [Glycine max]KHN04653.1 Protein O-glucosyltransferase 1 [Glycine soja]RZC01857.1 Protein O-glucosyltransferase 1 [Glycine soja]